VDAYRKDKGNSYDPKKGTGRTQKFGVPVGVVLAEVNLEVPKKMSNNKDDENDAGYRNRKLLADRGLIQCSNRVAGEASGRNGRSRRGRHNMHPIRKTNSVNVSPDCF
jgi:hypothetical protein